MYCSKCGKELKEDEKFCSQCGTYIKKNNTSVTRDSSSSITNKLQGFFNKAKETCVDLCNNFVPKVPVLEMEYSKEIEEILLNMGFKWAHSKINGYRLRLYKYYTDGIYIAKIEIETFSDKLSDVYIKLDYDKNEILGQIVYDIIRLRSYMYVRYTGTTESIKLIDFCNLNDIVDKNGNNKEEVSPAWFEVIINQNIYDQLEKDGYSNCSNSSKAIELKKEEIEIYAYFKSKNEMNLSNNLTTKIAIKPDKNKCSTNNNLAALNIIEFLKLKDIMRVEILKYADAYNFTHENISFYDFCCNLDFSFKMIGEYYYESVKDAPPQMFMGKIIERSYYKDDILKDRKYCKEHEFNKRTKRW